MLGPTFGIRCEWNCSCNRRKSHENPLLIAKVLQVLHCFLRCRCKLRKCNVWQEVERGLVFGFFLLFFCFLPMKKRKQCARCVNETPTKEKLTRLRLWNCNKRTKKHTCSCVAPGRQERVKNVGVTNLPPHAHKPHTNQSDRHHHLFLSHSETRLCFNGRLLCQLWAPPETQSKCLRCFCVSS